MGWQRITDRKKLVRASRNVGTELETLWEFVPLFAGPGDDCGVHTRAFRAVDGRTGYLYTDGYVDWDDRPSGPWRLRPV